MTRDRHDCVGRVNHRRGISQVYAVSIAAQTSHWKSPPVPTYVMAAERVATKQGCIRRSAAGFAPHRARRHQTVQQRSH